MDLVVETLVLEHIEALAGVYVEARRVLRDGGTFFLIELHPMRQLNGGRAEFAHPTTGEQVGVEAYLHEMSEYANAAIEAGF